MASTTSDEDTKKPFLLSSLLSQPQTFVEIIVGSADRSKKYVVHKDLICHHSPFFDRAFNGNFKEGQTQQMLLDDVDPKVFAVVAAWLYTDSIEPLDRSSEPERSNSVDTNEGVELIRNAKVWVLAQRFLMPKLQNTVLDDIYRVLPTTDYSHCFEFYSLIYAEDSSELQELAVAEYIYAGGYQAFLDHIDSLPRGMCSDIAECLSENGINYHSMPRQGRFHVETTT